MIYKFASGFQLKTDAQVVGECLQNIEKKHGQLNPGLVVQEAKDKDSPIHGEFEWDNKAAASKWREEQAKYILRAVIKVEVTARGEERNVRAFVNVGPQTGYTSIAKVLESPELTEKLLSKALADLRAWHSRYVIYKELTELCGTVDTSLRMFEEKFDQVAV